MSRTIFLPLDFLSWAHIKHTWKGDNDEFQKQVSFDSSKNLRPSLSLLGAKRPRNMAQGYIFYTNPKYFQSAWKKYHANSMETFGKIDENLTFADSISSELKNKFGVNPREPFCQLDEKLVLKNFSVSKRTPEIWPLGGVTYFTHF